MANKHIEPTFDMLELIRYLESRYRVQFEQAYEYSWDYASKVLDCFAFDPETNSGGWAWIRQVHIECIVYGNDDYEHVARKRGREAWEVEFIVGVLLKSPNWASSYEEFYSISSRQEHIDQGW
ncbi:hypothetical protein V5T82_10650 [Magnetovibrio sp. PR-2]|uniref:hypothetical protein n=1 Tax=Magnetovibrio sp. PR-2 TaxID=3120356 RepID=UPI002FCE1E40